MIKESKGYHEITDFIAKKNLSVYEEYKLKKLLDSVLKDDRKCLAAAIVKKVEENAGALKKSKKFWDLYLFILEKCFWETEVGTMEAKKLTLKIISDFTSEVIEKFGLEDDEEILFVLMLQMGLNKMDDDKILKFSPDRMIFRKYASSKADISYIPNPYSEEETEKIMNWAKTHPASVLTQATSLWFTKGLTLKDIVNLTKKDCWGENCIEREGIELFRTSFRAKIVRRALDMHPPKVEYVFSVPNSDGSGWKKLTEKGLLINLKHICKQTGIIYKPILVNEAIILTTN